MTSFYNTKTVYDRKIVSKNYIKDKLGLTQHTLYDWIVGNDIIVIEKVEPKSSFFGLF